MLVIPAPSVARIYLCMPIGTRALWRCDLALFPAEFATLERLSPCQHWAEDCVAIFVTHRAAALSSFAQHPLCGSGDLKPMGLVCDNAVVLGIASFHCVLALVLVHRWHTTD